MAAGWIANLVAVLDQDSVPSHCGETSPQSDIDAYLGNDSTEFTTELDYLGYLATLRISLEDTENGNAVSVCIDCLPDADKRAVCEKAIASRGAAFAREGVDVRIDFALEDFFELKAQCCGVSNAAELVHAVGLVVQSLGEVLEEMDDLWDPFGSVEDDEFIEDDGIAEELLDRQRAAIVHDVLSMLGDSEVGGPDELLG